MIPAHVYSVFVCEARRIFRARIVANQDCHFCRQLNLGKLSQVTVSQDCHSEYFVSIRLGVVLSAKAIQLAASVYMPRQSLQHIHQFQPFEGIEIMTQMRVLVMSIVLFVTLGAVAQTSTASQSGTDTDIALLRSDVQAQKTDIIAHTMQFTDPQAKAFWPLYREYAHQQQIIGDQRVSLIKDYADQYDTIDDTKANDLMDRLLKFDKDRTDLRAKYYPKFRSAIGAKEAAKFFQVDNRLNLVVDLQIASAVPIVQ